MSNVISLDELKMKTDGRLLALIKSVRNRAMSPAERYAQRRSFLRGMCPSNRNYEDWCRLVDEMYPPPSKD